MNALRCLLILLCFSSCGILSTSTKYDLKDNNYKLKGAKHGYYVEIEEDTINLYEYCLQHADPCQPATKYPSQLAAQQEPLTKAVLYRNSLDIDVLTMPFKYRPRIGDFPNQLNTSFNGAFYIGYRTDRYSLSYEPVPLKEYKRAERHYGYSIGAFSGIGSTFMNPWVTQYNIASEYDGFVWLNGIAGIVAIQNLNFVIGIGVDLLLDYNKTVWIYQGKPWVGAAIGLNLY